MRCAACEYDDHEGDLAGYTRRFYEVMVTKRRPDLEDIPKVGYPHRVRERFELLVNEDLVRLFACPECKTVRLGRHP